MKDKISFRKSDKNSIPNDIHSELICSISVMVVLSWPVSVSHLISNESRHLMSSVWMSLMTCLQVTYVSFIINVVDLLPGWIRT